MEKTAQDLYKELTAEAKTMDWYYSYSDDFNVYKRGSESMDKFKSKFMELHYMDKELAGKLRVESIPSDFNIYYNA